MLSFVFATDIAYVVEDSSEVSNNILNEINNLGYSYDVIYEGGINSANWSNYSMILLGSGRVYGIPVSSHKSLIINPSYYTGWSESIGVTTLNKAFNFNNYLTQNLEGEFKPYTENNQELHYLTRKKNSTSVTVKGDSIVDKGNFVIAKKESPRRIFFGITQSDKWSSTSRDLFSNSLTWVLKGEDKDEDGFYTENDCNDLDSSINPDAEEIAYNGVDEDCSGEDLTDVDGDGFDSFEVGGLDCNDNDVMYNPDSEDIYLNCRNDAPVLSSQIRSISVFEGNIATVYLSAVDAEGDNITYFSNDSRFVETEEGVFQWQTNYYDSGEYVFTFGAKDFELESTDTVEVRVINRNQEPTCTDLPSFYFEEDTSLEINLSTYCSDLDNDTLYYYFYDTSDNENIILNSLDNETGIVNFSSVQDWNGQDWIRFAVSDLDEVTITTRADIYVTPVNDAVEFSGEIPNFTWSEDTNKTNAFNLNDYFFDVDGDELNYLFEGNDKIGIEINYSTGMVSFYPEKDFYGVEEVYFVGFDFEPTIAESNKFILEVIDANEPPVFEDLNCEDYIAEDFSYSCIVNASDFEGDELNYEVISENNMDCSFEENNLTYQGNQDYFGNASCVLRVSDSLGYDEVEFSVEIVNENDAPDIDSFSPGNNFVKILEGSSKMFSIDYSDLDSGDVFVAWALNGKKVGEENSFNFNKEIGEYNLAAIVSDGLYIDYKEWNVSVQAIGSFTCNEVSGFICSENQICSQDYLGVSDSAVCCPVACSARPPEFSDAKTCSAEGLDLDSLLEVEIRDPDSGDEFVPGEEIEVEIRVNNEFSEDLRVDLDAYLYDLTDEKEIENKDDSFKIDLGDSETIEFLFDLDRDLEDNEYAIFVRVIDDDEIICNEAYNEIDVAREDDDVEFNLKSETRNLVCGDTLVLDYEIRNFGTNDYEDTYITIKNNELGIDFESDFFDLDEFDGSKDKRSSSINLKIPEDSEEGEYTLEGIYYFDDGDLRERSNIEISLGECSPESLVISDSEIIIGDSKVNENKRTLFSGVGSVISDKVSALDKTELIILIVGILFFFILLILVILRA